VKTAVVSYKCSMT